MGLGRFDAALASVLTGESSRGVAGGLGYDDLEPVSARKAGPDNVPLPYVASGGGLGEPSSLFGGVGGTVPCLLIVSIFW
jgi:hypothetical protein